MIYILIALFLLLLSYNYEFKQNDSRVPNTRWFPFILFVFTIIAGFRDGLGVDTKNYVDFFKQVPTIDYLSKSYFDFTRFRPGFVVFYSICKFLINNITFAFVLESLFVNYVVLLFIKKHTKYPYLSVLLYFIINYLEFNMEIQREAIAVALVLLAWMKYEDKKYIYSLCCFALATTFHISSIFAITIPLLDKIKFNKMWIVIAIVLIVVIPTVFFAIPNLSVIVELLLNSNQSAVVDEYTAQSFNQDLNLNYFLLHLIHYGFMAYALYYLKSKGHNRYAGHILIYMVLMYMTAVSYGFYRFTNYLACFYILVLSDFLICFLRTNRFVRKIPKLVLVVFLVYLTYYHESKLMIYDEVNLEYSYERYFPYKSILFS